MRWKRVAWASCLAPVLGGCHLTFDAARELTADPYTAATQAGVEHRIHSDARAAWREVRSEFPRRAFTAEFRDGFLDGYSDYLDRGGSAQPPAVPPAKYTRNKKYYTPEGHALLKDYFLGFKYGVDVAVATGQRQFLTVPVLVPEVEPGAAVPATPPVVAVPPPVVTAPPPAVPFVPPIPPGGSPVIPDAPPAGASPLGTPRPLPPTPGPNPPVPAVPLFPSPGPAGGRFNPNPSAPSGQTPAGSTAAGPGAKFGPAGSPAREPVALPVPAVPVPVLPAGVLPPVPPGGAKFDLPAPAVGDPKPVSVSRLPEPPPEVPTLPVGVPTPPVADDLPVLAPIHTVAPPLPPTHTVPADRDPDRNRTER